MLSFEYVGLSALFALVAFVIAGWEGAVAAFALGLVLGLLIKWVMKNTER